jgi:hypothetical protein
MTDTIETTAREKAVEIVDGWLAVYPKLVATLSHNQVIGIQCAIADALREERDNCAKIAENFSEELAADGELYIGYLIAAAIRNRSISE